MMWFKTPSQRRLECMTPEQLRLESDRVARYAAEQLQRKPSRVEALARAYCEELGYDPDGQWLPGPMMLPVKRWTKYRDVAENALHKDALDKALRKIVE